MLKSQTMINKLNKQLCLGALAGTLLLFLNGCQGVRYDPSRATRQYPQELHHANSVNIQVFRHDTSIEIINATTQSFKDFDVWINQQFVHRLETLPAGQTVSVSLWEFYDVRGESFNAGGFWRADEPGLVRLVEIQSSETQPLIGLVTIPSEAIQ